MLEQGLADQSNPKPSVDHQVIQQLTQRLAESEALVDKLRINLNLTIKQVQELTRRINKLESGF